MLVFSVVLIVIVAVLMCLIVLVQNSKGGGLASGFASSNQIMGVRKTTDFLEKATWTLAVLMVILSVVSAYSVASNNKVAEGYTGQQQTAPVTAPATTPSAPLPNLPAAPAPEAN